MMMTQSWQRSGAARSGLVRRLRDGTAASAGRVALWLDRYRQRDLLLGLDDRMLRDIGLTSDERVREATKPFWRE